jgi:drug/metabolite transporter (DMT)-like permease
MTPVAALWASIVVGACGQVMLKLGVNGDSARTSARSVRWWTNLLFSGWLWGYGLCFVGALLLWLRALSHINISYAFPLLSVGYILVALLSKLLLQEQVGWRRWVAIAVICVGVTLIVRN